MIDVNMFDSFKVDVEDALKDVAKKYNVDIKAGHISYGSISFKLGLEVTQKVNGASDAGEATWSYYCGSYGFKRDDYGKIVTIKGEKYRISGINERSKYHILVKRVKDDVEYGFLPGIVREALDNLERGE